MLLVEVDGLRVGYSWVMASFIKTYLDVARRNRKVKMDAAMDAARREKQAKMDVAPSESGSKSAFTQRESNASQSFAFALFMSKMMAFVGFLLFCGGLTFGVYLTYQSNGYGISFFDRHDLAVVGIPLIASAFTFGLPFAAVGAYMSAKLRNLNH